MPKYHLLKNKITGIRSIYNKETKEKILESENPSLYRELRKKALRNLKRQDLHETYTSLGLTKVKSSLGNVFYE